MPPKVKPVSEETKQAIKDFEENNICVRMRGLPYSARVEDIKQFFDGIELKEDGVHIVSGADGRPTGEAYVQFTSDDGVKQAMKLLGDDLVDYIVAVSVPRGSSRAHALRSQHGRSGRQSGHRRSQRSPTAATCKSECARVASC